MSRLHRSLWIIAPVFALALLAAACGSDSEGSLLGEAEGLKDSVVDSAQDTTTTEPAQTTTSEAAAAQSGAEGDLVAEGDTVSVHYVGTLDSGEQFDSSRERGPLTFSVGSGQMIAGFDAAVRGMRVGELKTVRLEPAEAYGEEDPAAFVEVSIDQVPEGIKVGDQLMGPGGQAVIVAEVNGDVVVINANHNLAGQSLTFEIEVVSIES